MARWCLTVRRVRFLATSYFWEGLLVHSVELGFRRGGTDRKGSRECSEVVDLSTLSHDFYGCPLPFSVGLHFFDLLRLTSEIPFLCIRR